MEALYYHKNEGAVECCLCPRDCKIGEGEVGFCKVRKNVNGKLISLVYGKIIALAIDPIEKKPLFHFLPGEKILSFGTVGCNLKCNFCQNWEISQVDSVEGEEILPKDLVDLAISKNCKMIAATYNEPTIFFEFMLDVFKLAKKKGLKTVVVSNGFINKKPLLELINHVDAFNIDLKSIDSQFYTSMTKSWIKPILENIKLINDSKAHLELTNLVISGKNENFKDLIEWVVNNLGRDVPIHFSAFFPMYQLLDVEATKKNKLDEVFSLAKGRGVNYVYRGNILEEESTFCAKCNELLIKRRGYCIFENKIVEGKCFSCFSLIPGVFKLKKEK